MQNSLHSYICIFITTVRATHLANLFNLSALKIYDEDCEVCRYAFFAVLPLLPLCES